MSEIIGNIKLIGETKSFGANGFTKREIVITVADDKYPQHILVEFIKDKCALLDKFKVDQGVKIAINILGREWINPEGEAKYFNAIQGWKIELIEGQQSEVDKYEAANENSHIPDNEEDTDDLPF